MKKLYYLTKDFETPVCKFEKGCSYLPHIWASLLGLENEQRFLDLLKDDYMHSNFKTWFEAKD